MNLDRQAILVDSGGMEFFKLTLKITSTISWWSRRKKYEYVKLLKKQPHNLLHAVQQPLNGLRHQLCETALLPEYYQDNT